jgi:hypothetical protein
MNPEILYFITEEQRGKSGIYPYRVAEAVSAHFKIGIDEALKHVNYYIRNYQKLEIEV